jgi:hypothetical protein
MDQKTQGELLFHCLSMGTDEIRAARLEQLSATDWDGVIRQSVKHGVTPLLYQRSKALGPGTNIPASVVHRLREAYLHSAARNMRLYHDLAKVLTVLRNEDIPVIVLKGAHLAQVVYGNTALRPMVDVDLLVRGTDLPRVEEKLQEIDYGPSGHSGIGVGRKMSYHLPLAKPDAVPVEIHWSIAHPAGPFKIDVDGLWERARPATIAGVEVLVLSPEDLLVHLCLHASFTHLFNIGLGPFCDISETLRHYWDEMDWEQVQLCALQWGAGKCVYLTLYLARELLEAAVPDEVLNAFEPNDLDLSLVIWAKKQIFTGQGYTGLLAPNLARMWEANRLQDKVTIFSKVAFPSPEVMATMYPASPFSKRIYLYYPIRLMDLLLRHGRAAWRLLRHDKEIIAAAERENIRNALID